MVRSTATRPQASTGMQAGVFTIAKNEAELRGVDAVALLELGGHGHRKA